MSVSSIYIKVDGERVRVIEQKNKKKCLEEGFEEVDAFYYGEYLSGENKGRRGIMTDIGGKISLYQLLFALFAVLCLNLLDYELTRTHIRYVRNQPRIENTAA